MAPLRFAGRVSYFLYLFHLPALALSLALGLHSAGTVLPGTALVLGVSAWASRRRFEGPLIALGRGLRYQAAG
jgi:peptidoglycan/LPS O-acetylase OafA/YrhL